jgi:F0F1-type ATP synthase membrane subunit b/b'
VEIHEKIDELIDLVEGARSVPMSASCVVNRSDVLDRLDEVRRLLPVDLQRADSLLADSHGVLAEAQGQAEGIVAAAHEERMQLVSQTEVQAQAEREAGRIIAAAEQETERMQREVDDYIDAKLANFELVLSKTLEAVARGRDKIQGRRAVEDLSQIGLPELDEDAGYGEPEPGPTPQQ